jgi:hypothetical protein
MAMFSKTGHLGHLDLATLPIKVLYKLLLLLKVVKMANKMGDAREDVSQISYD